MFFCWPIFFRLVFYVFVFFFAIIQHVPTDDFAAFFKEVESEVMRRMSGKNTLRKLRKEGGWGSMPSEVFEPLEAALQVLEDDLKNDKKEAGHKGKPTQIVGQGEDVSIWHIVQQLTSNVLYIHIHTTVIVTTHGFNLIATFFLGPCYVWPTWAMGRIAIVIAVA